MKLSVEEAKKIYEYLEIAIYRWTVDEGLGNFAFSVLVGIISGIVYTIWR